MTSGACGGCGGCGRAEVGRCCFVGVVPVLLTFLATWSAVLIPRLAFVLIMAEQRHEREGGEDTRKEDEERGE